MDLTNSKRLIYTASHVATQLTPEDQAKVEAKPGGGFRKANLLRALAIKPDELNPLRERIDADERVNRYAEINHLFDISKRLAVNTPPVSTPELAGLLAPIPDGLVTAFARLATEVKQDTAPLKFLIDLYDQQRRVLPIGRLHLERLEMYPAGVEKGELVFTVPMAPGETVTISHKEWSTSSREFEDIVNDQFESFSERGVAEKTDASMSTDSESKRSSALNFGASLSGGFAGVTLTTTLGLSSANEERTSVKQTMQKNREVTEKASARSRKEHKVSVKLETKSGVEDNAFRTITNPGLTAMRVDYYRMMRKWRTDLFRYGLRLTYDIAIPTPGVRLWALHQRVREIDEQLRTPFAFGLLENSLNEVNYHGEALKVGATDVDDPPAPVIETILHGDAIHWEGQSANYQQARVEFDVPDGYRLLSALFTANVVFGIHTAENEFDFRVQNAEPTAQLSWSPGQPYIQQLLSSLPQQTGGAGHMVVEYQYRAVESASIQVQVTFQRTLANWQRWQHAVWKELRAAAAARHAEVSARLQEERDRLWRLLNGKDTLTLRRLEREELLRLIVQWLVGPSHPVLATAQVDQALSDLHTSEHLFQSAATPPPVKSLPIDEKAWAGALMFGVFVKFIQQAIEWENLVYFLYPYFWGSETVGRDKMLFEHPDPEHERFLRAGYARIVLTVRPDFEKAFTNFVESGSLSPDFVSSYMPIATEIANFAKTNYAGIPPANPETQGRPLLYPEQRATWDTMQKLMAQIDDYKAANDGYPETLGSLQGPEKHDAWGHPFVYRQPGLGADYDLISLGADGTEGGDGLDADISSAAGASLVATWFDYTPTSALDIEVDTKAADIA